VLEQIAPSQFTNSPRSSGSRVAKHSAGHRGARALNPAWLADSYMWGTAVRRICIGRGGNNVEMAERVGMQRLRSAPTAAIKELLPSDAGSRIRCPG